MNCFGTLAGRCMWLEQVHTLALQELVCMHAALRSPRLLACRDPGKAASRILDCSVQAPIKRMHASCGIGSGCRSCMES